MHNDDDEKRESLTNLMKKDQKNRRVTLNQTNDDDENGSALHHQLEDNNRKKYLKWGLIGGAILIVLILAIALPIALSGKGGGGDDKKPDVKPPVLPNSTNPYFSDPTSVRPLGYSLSGQLKIKTNKLLESTAAEDFVPKIGVDWNQTIKFGQNNKQAGLLNFTFDMIDYKIARLSLSDGNDSSRYSVPSEMLNKPEGERGIELESVGFDYHDEDSIHNPFSFSFHDVSDPSNVFVTTAGQNLVFSDKYIQMDFVLPSQRQYGFGERSHSFKLGEGAWGMWANSQDNGDLDDGRGRGGQYGVHPFILVQSKKPQEYIGMFFRNSNPQVPILRFNDETGAAPAVAGTTTLSYIALGGELEVYFFVHGTAKQIVQDYHRFIGKAHLPPFWALGWQEASVRGGSQEALEAQVKLYHDMKLPLEAVYLERTSSSSTRNFALNTTQITNMNTLRQNMTAANLHLIAYLDSAIYTPAHPDSPAENPVYNEGNTQNVFIKTSIYNTTTYNNNLLGKQSQQQCVYLDWFNYEHMSIFWQEQIANYYSQVHFDGLWTTDNEPFNAIQGEIKGAEIKLQSVSKEQQQSYFDNKWYSTSTGEVNSTYYLPFMPGFVENGPFDVQSLSLNATHTNYSVFNPVTGQREYRNEQEYNLHSLYSHAMMQTTYKEVLKIAEMKDKRQFLVTRGTFASTGRYASYAYTAKLRTWESLQYSIPHIMNMNMFGLPHSGADVCGIQDPTTTATLNEELCLRWLQLATFFPLARHSQTFSPEQYTTGPLGFTTKEYVDSAKATMHDRMQYLRLLYTCLFESSELGGTCFDPLYFHYTTDLESFKNETGTNDTFIVANTIKVSPVTTARVAGQDTYPSHFPEGRWVNLADFSEVLIVTNTTTTQHLKYRPTVNAHLRPGSAIPYQPNSDQSLLTTADLLAKPITIVFNRDQNGASQGTLLLDEGKTRSEIANQTYEYYTILHKETKSIQFQLTRGQRGKQDKSLHRLEKIAIVDAEDIWETDFACAFMVDGSIQELFPEYDKENKVLYIDNERFTPDLHFSKINNIFYGSSSKKDLNLCREMDYEYMVPEDFENMTAVLNSNAGEIPLVHKAGVLPNLTVYIRCYDEGIMNVKWTWAGVPEGKRKHFGVPDDIVHTYKFPRVGDAIGRHVIVQRNPFLLNFTKQQGQTEPFFQISNIVYDSYLSWIGMRAFTQKKENFRGVIGLGERSQRDLFYGDGIYSMWGFDQQSKLDIGALPGRQGSGMHPFFMYQHQPQHWVGVFFKSSQAQDWIIKNNPIDGQVQLKQISTGGITDIYIMFQAQKPDSVIGFYQSIIGKPVLQPQWALGWHQGKACTKNQDELRAVVDNYRKNKIPLDAQWHDTEYMSMYRDFTVDHLNFENLTHYVNDMYDNLNIKTVPILDSGIAMRPGQNYSAYDQGVEAGVFLKAPQSQDSFIGRQWPNEVVYPDYTHPNTSKWWGNLLTDFQQNKVYFDGIWLDMNEPSNFCNGPCHARQRSPTTVMDEMTYLPTGRSLQYKSLPVDILQANSYLQLDTHSYYGTQQAKMTHDWFIENGVKRPFVVTKSTFSGVGKYASHFLSGMTTTYNDMERTVVGTMMMNVFGIPMSGGDICGFSGKTPTPELCARWHQVGAFQPLSRNHRECVGKPQEPYRFMDSKVGNTNRTITDVMTDAILAKYSLIRYYYTQMFLLSNDPATVGSFYKPMFFEFPNDNLAYMASPAQNVMLGSALKLSIKTQPSQNWTDDFHQFYFPEGNWCDILRPETLCVYSGPNGTNELLPSGLEDYQVHLRDGFIIPMQNASVIRPYTSDDLRRERVDLHIHPQNKTQSNTTVIFQASGQYVNDDGISTQEMTLEGGYNHYHIVFTYRDEVNNRSDDENIKLTIGLKANATEFWLNETKCSNVSMSDYLGSIFIMDEVGLFQRTIYNVELLRPDMTFSELGLAKFDQVTNRLVYDIVDGMKHNDAAERVCLGFVQEIRFRPAIM